MKKIVALIANVIMAAVLFAEAPELKNMMPNSWRKLTRLSEQEERAFVSQGEGKKSMDEFMKKHFWENSFDFRVYRETECGIDFYRLLICGGKLKTLLSQTYGDTIFGDRESAEYAKFHGMRRASTAQIVFARDKDSVWKEIWNMPVRDHLAVEPISSPWTDVFVFYDLMIRKLNGQEIGFFTTEASIGIRVGNGEPVYFPDSEGLPWGSAGGAFGAYYAKTKGQLAGGCTMYFIKRGIDEEISGIPSDDGIRISPSSYLFDPKCPLKYSIQNAFDGNPATSYVENTNDDLFKIDFDNLRQNVIVGLVVINGYASNENLYYSNNRMADFQYNSSSKTDYINNVKLKDRTIGYQKFESCFPNAPTSIASGIKKIFKGSKYNDTCLAELNFICSDGNYLFGEINE